MSHNKKKLTVALWITVFSFVLLTTAAYAWMSIASTLKVTELALTVIANNNLEIAQDINGPAGEWTSVMSMSDLLSGDTVLRPVTYSAKREAFLAPRYGLDGRPNFTDPMLITHTGTALSSPDGEDNVGAYLLAYNFWMRAGANCTVSLTEAKEISEGLMGGGTYVIGKPIWNTAAVRHEDGGRGAQNALRIAFRTYGDDESDGSGGSFIIYEPNADAGGVYEATPSIDGSETLISPDKLIQQHESGWSEQNPVLRDNVDYQVGGFISDSTVLFALKADKPRLVTLFIWLEGQDRDCINSISMGEILVNLQFSGDQGGTIVSR